jgi:hypothetical protein
MRAARRLEGAKRNRVSPSVGMSTHTENERVAEEDAPLRMLRMQRRTTTTQSTTNTTAPMASDTSSRLCRNCRYGGSRRSNVLVAAPKR